MNPLAELDSLDLDPTAKSQVVDMIRALLEQAGCDAELLHLKDAQIQAKDLKIEALTHESPPHPLWRQKRNLGAAAARRVRGNLEYRPGRH